MKENNNNMSSLIKNQIKDIPLDKKLNYNDIQRISNNLSDDIFSDKCCIWNGSIINNNSNKKNCYISFFFKNKKVSLHRLLYMNYVDNLNDNEYIKYTCNNKGKCCTLNHFKKITKFDDNNNNNDNTNDNNKDDTNDNNKDDTNDNNNKNDNKNNNKDDNNNNNKDDKKDDNNNKNINNNNNNTNNKNINNNIITF